MGAGGGANGGLPPPPPSLFFRAGDFLDFGDFDREEEEEEEEEVDEDEEEDEDDDRDDLRCRRSFPTTGSKSRNESVDSDTKVAISALSRL